MSNINQLADRLYDAILANDFATFVQLLRDNELISLNKDFALGWRKGRPVLKKKNPKKPHKQDQELHQKETKRISGGGVPLEPREFPGERTAIPEREKKRGIKW